ncbi:SDR family NAD(P)-dependent oxidoreductase [Geofilum rubicundum]|uniref:Oxidoreductase, short-chain dehydrogenase/reductase family n=1 Tax=Geofilum rubicundum JCM 15548 TaxID=1236989 RepID=A0A0E9LU01_9BACT|nr:SDR family NAD(P)-dependent oxidoreductase [Geofilum rubicundum]GAO29047.1 oxidoreductase, short-chain dehydrogenase/reductase family [Geofilum rubicundum JCM 15548]
MDFFKKTIWITGAASGMGKAVAIALAPYQTTLILSDRDAEGLEVTAREATKKGAHVLTRRLDMSDTNAISTTAQEVLRKGYQINALYQFAGISQRSVVTETPIENDRKIMEINFIGVVALTKALLPHMIENGGGQLAAASSLVGKFGFPYRSAYSASKHALHGFFESIAAENYPNNIRISLLIGGRIRTNISKFAIDKSGQEHGQMDPGQANGISPEKAAQQILRGLRKEKLEIPVGGKELLILKIKRFFPNWHSKLVRKINPM